MSVQTRIRWGAVLLGAFLTEAITIAFAIPFRQYGQDVITLIALIGSFLLPLLFAVWVGRRAQGRFVLHGVLIGAFAVLIYLTLSEAGRRFGPPQPPQPFAYTIAHGLKLLGGALGGVIASRLNARAGARERVDFPPARSSE
jgi:putative membrane protein (TIGR04086 family)